MEQPTPDPSTITAPAITTTAVNAKNAAIANIAPEHRLLPAWGESFDNPDAALHRLQDWAFIQGFAIVVESRATNRVRYECIHHKQETRNWRQLDEEDRTRHNTILKGKNCKWSAYISQLQRTGDQWILKLKETAHTHPLNPDPFCYDQHKAKRVGFSTAIARASVYRGEASLSSANRLLRRENLPILGRWDYYNLNRQYESGVKLPQSDEVQLIYSILQDRNFHVQARYNHQVDEYGQHQGTRIMRDLFFINSQQIELGRRFVSGFMYQTDATFNTNSRRLPLSSIIGITNTGTTFPLAYCYITSESAACFEFVAQELTRYVFWDCPEAAIIVGDFTKGLGAAIAAKAKLDKVAAARLKVNQVVATGGFVDIDDLVAPTQMLGSQDDGIPAIESVTITDEHMAVITEVRLQLCEWHAIEAIKRRLIADGYDENRRKSVMILIRAWIHASTREAIIEARRALYRSLDLIQQAYLKSYYVPKEPHFLRFYTRRFANLGVHSTQRTEGHHVITKRKLHKSLPLSTAIDYISTDLTTVMEKHHAIVNTQRRSRPRLLDMRAFALTADFLTHYCLEKAMDEWAITKNEADRARNCGGPVQPLLDPIIGCQQHCELPLRFGIPCKHWMHYSIHRNCALPISLFHPRWLYDGPAVLHDGWTMTWNMGIMPASPNYDPYMPSTIVDRFANHGTHIITDIALLATRAAEALPADTAEKFVNHIHDVTAAMIDKVQAKQRRHDQLPMLLPEPLPLANVRAKRRQGGRGTTGRGMTGREAAEAAERDAIRETSRIAAAVAAHNLNRVAIAAHNKEKDRLRIQEIDIASRAQDEIDAQLHATTRSRSESPIIISSSSNSDDSENELAEMKLESQILAPETIRRSNRPLKVTAKARELQLAANAKSAARATEAVRRNSRTRDDSAPSLQANNPRAKRRKLTPKAIAEAEEMSELLHESFIISD